MSEEWFTEKGLMTWPTKLPVLVKGRRLRQSGDFCVQCAHRRLDTCHILWRMHTSLSV